MSVELCYLCSGHVCVFRTTTSRNKGERKSAPRGLAKVRFPVTRAREIIVCLALAPVYALARPAARVEENHKGEGKDVARPLCQR
jgi:hypothetical protein